MRRPFALLPVLALGLMACSDLQESISPRMSNRGSAVATSVPNGLGPATVIYTNFGPGMTFDLNPTDGWGINGFLGPCCGQSAISQQFATPRGQFTFARATVALESIAGPARIRVFLQADFSGKPGPIVEEMVIDSIGSAPAIYAVNSALAPVLADTLYWLTVAAGGNGVVAGWPWNSIGDVSSGNWAGTESGGPSGPWGVGLGVTRSAFQIEGRPISQRGAIVHQASGGGTVVWERDGNVDSTMTYAVNARLMADGSVSGELLYNRHGDTEHIKGTVTCLRVVGNRAYITGDIGQARPGVKVPHFAVALEDNGEGSNATAPDRVSAVIFLPDGWPSCYPYFPSVDLTNGNAQVR
jgi:hypothetical protein